MSEKYISAAKNRLGPRSWDTETTQELMAWDAMDVANQLEDGSVKLVLTSPPYSDLLARPIVDLSRKVRGRENRRYSLMEDDLGNMGMGQADGGYLRQPQAQVDASC